MRDLKKSARVDGEVCRALFEAGKDLLLKSPPRQAVIDNIII